MSENEEKTTQENAEQQPVAESANDKVEKKEKKKKKRDSATATKESFCAVFALFSALILFILCTKDLVFGDIGKYVHELLTGTFGYGAYLLMFLVGYNCVAGFFGFKLFKKRAPIVMTIVTLVLAALAVQSITTWNIADEMYLSACFVAGEFFPNTPPLGWLGALPIALIRLLMTKIGATVFLSGVALFFAAITFVPMLRKKAKNASKADKPNEGGFSNQAVGAEQQAQQPSAQTPYMQQPPYVQQPYGQPYVQQSGYGQPFATQQGQPVYPQSAPWGYTQTQQPVQSPVVEPHLVQPMQQEQPSMVEQPQPMPGYQPGAVAPQNMDGYYAPYGGGYGMRQRPGVSLPNDEDVQSPTNAQQAYQQSFTQQQPQGRVFSPFGSTGVGQADTHRQITPEESRRILFGGTPQQNYRDNLIFDTSYVGHRPAYDGQQTSPSTYSQAYAQSVDSGVRTRPTMVAQDVQGATFGSQQQPTYQTPSQQSPIMQNPPVSSQHNEVDPYRLNDRYAENTQYRVPQAGQEPLRTENDRTVAEAATTETPVESVDEGRYGGRDYRDVFSLSNPNVFGTDRTAQQQPTESVRESRADVYTDRSSIFDDDEPSQMPAGDDPYSLRTYDDAPMRGVPTVNETRGGLNVEENGRDLRGGAYDVAQDRRVVDETPSDGHVSSCPLPSQEKQSPMVQPTQMRSEQPKQEPQVNREPPKPRVKKPYVRVPLNYFDATETLPDTNEDEVERIKDVIIATLADYKVYDATIASVTFGPTVTRYNVEIPRNVSPRKVVALEQEIAISLCCKGINIYPSFEDGAVSIEVPNRKRQFVHLGCMFNDDGFINAKPTSLTFAMGKDVANKKVFGDICKMTHLLVAGSSGSGKSVFLGSLIISLITKYSPDDLRLILIDPKKTEFVLYNNLPHLMINEIITDVHKSIQSLNWAIGEMNRRYTLLEKKSLSGTYVVNIDEYNAHLEKGEEKLPKIVIIVDELADLMLAAKKDLEDRIQNLTQKARAAGIHLILATQRPSADVITGVIKSNLSTRIAFTVASDVDSRVILDLSGAQKLLGYGDMLYTTPGINTPVRVQSPFISSGDSQKVVDFIKANNEAFYDEAATAYINNARVGGATADHDEPMNGEVEGVYIQALKLVIQSGSASISMLQRKCGVGFNKAGKIIEWMEAMEYISPFEGAKARKVLITKEDFEALYGEF